MKIKVLLSLIYVLGIPILASLLPQARVAVVTTHTVFNSLVVGTLLFSRRLSDPTEVLYGAAFLFLALADLLYGFTGELILNQSSIVPDVFVREFSYMSFSIFFAAALGLSYRSSLKKPRNLIATAGLALGFMSAGVHNVLAPLFYMPDRALIFVISGTVYCIFRSFILAVSIQQMMFERNLARFLFLFSIAQMFISELSYTFQTNVIEAPHTPLNLWLDKGW